jgi:hypothetical protein
MLRSISLYILKELIMKLKLLALLVSQITRNWFRYYPKKPAAVVTPVAEVLECHVFQGYRDIVTRFWGLAVESVDPFVIDTAFWKQPVVMLNDCLPEFIERQLSGVHENVVVLESGVFGKQFAALELCAEGGFHTILLLKSDAIELGLDVEYVTARTD